MVAVRYDELETLPGLLEASTNAGCLYGTRMTGWSLLKYGAPSSGALAYPCVPSGDTLLMANFTLCLQVGCYEEEALNRPLGPQGIMPQLQPLFPPSLASAITFSQGL